MAPSSPDTEALETADTQPASACKEDALDARCMHEVWDCNFDKEFEALVSAAAKEGANVALDMEFPGFLCQEPRSGERALRYQALRENVDSLRPIQFGAAVASADGSLLGVWSFNLRFDVKVDLHSEKSVAFLRNAGIDFPRHAAEGIEAAKLGRRLADSCLVGHHKRTPWWITFSGAYDLGYLLKLLTTSQPLPLDADGFEAALSTFCPRRHELRDHLPHGSLDSLARKHGVRRHGRAHTAGSDALLTLDLYLSVVHANSREPPSTDRFEQWKDQWAVDEVWAASMEHWQSGYSDWDATADMWGTKWDTWGSYTAFQNQAVCMFWLPTMVSSPPPWYMTAPPGWSLGNYTAASLKASRSAAGSSSPASSPSSSGGPKVMVI